MAVSASTVAFVGSGTDATSYDTTSYTPTADRLMTAVVENSFVGTPNTPTLTGNGLTWDEVVSYLCDTSGTAWRLTLFVAKSGSSPTTGVVTADLAGQLAAGGAVIVDEWDGADLAGTALAAIVQSKTGSVNTSGMSETITLDAGIGGGNASAGAIQHQANEATTEGSGYARLGTALHSGPSSSLLTEYKATGSTVVDGSWATSIQIGGLAWEVKAAGAGGQGSAATLTVTHRRRIRIR